MAEAAQTASGFLPSPVGRVVMKHAGVDRLAAFNMAISLVRRGGTVSLSGVYGGAADPVNLMTYVTYVFQKLFGYSEPHATKLMLQVHQEGKAVVSAGTRESMEVDVSKLHAAGLWATLQQDS